MFATDRKLRVFLCHASQDKPIVRELYQRLLAEGWIDPWLDEEKLLPGQDWDMEIEKAVESADVVLVCLSNRSVTKDGYIQRELKFVLDIALEKPEGTIFVIPLRLEECDLPRRLRSWQYVDYFPVSQRKPAYQRLLRSLQLRFDGFKGKSEAEGKERTLEVVSPPIGLEKDSPPTVSAVPDHLNISVPTTARGILDLAGFALPVVFLFMMSMYFLGPGDSNLYFLIGIVAVVTGGVVGLDRRVIESKWVKLSIILFIIVHSSMVYSDYSGGDYSSILKESTGIVALLAAGARLLNFKSLRKPGVYASVFFAVYLFLYGIKLILNTYNIYLNVITIPTIVIGFIAAIFMWLEQ